MCVPYCMGVRCPRVQRAHSRLPLSLCALLEVGMRVVALAADQQATRCRRRGPSDMHSRTEGM